MDQEKKLVFLPFLSNPVEQHRWAVTVGGKKVLKMSSTNEKINEWFARKKINVPASDEGGKRKREDGENVIRERSPL